MRSWFFWINVSMWKMIILRSRFHVKNPYLSCCCHPFFQAKLVIFVCLMSWRVYPLWPFPRLSLPFSKPGFFQSLLSPFQTLLACSKALLGFFQSFLGIIFTQPKRLFQTQCQQGTELGGNPGWTYTKAYGVSHFAHMSTKFSPLKHHCLLGFIVCCW